MKRRTRYLNNKISTNIKIMHFSAAFYKLFKLMRDIVIDSLKHRGQKNNPRYAEATDVK